METNYLISINMPHLLVNLSTSLDFSRQGITDHHKRVAVLSVMLALQAGVNDEDLKQIFQSAIIHDIGAVNWSEKNCLLTYDIAIPHQHCIKGAQLLKDTKTLGSIENIILCHHDFWQGNNYSGLERDLIPLASRIIHLADRLEVLIDPTVHILDQRDYILSRLTAGAGTIFDPDLVLLLQEMTERESFWLELVSPWMDETLTALPLWQAAPIGFDELFDLANLFAGVIDCKSPFTRQHSHGVSVVASCLGRKAGLSEDDANLLAIAGLLHDIGKLSVPESILEKPAALTGGEMHWIKQHSYYTYKILQPLAPSTRIPQWAAYHHEKLNGSGYPFGRSEHQLDLPSRIVAIADIFNALHEDRPYRKGLSWEAIINILNEEVKKGCIDADLRTLLWDNRKEIESRCQSL